MQLSMSPHLVAVHQPYLAELQKRLSEDDDRDQEPKEKGASLRLYLDREQQERPYDLVKTVAILPLRGMLFKRGWWWGSSYDYFSDLVRLAVADFAVDTILIDVESPGGICYGCPDCSDVLYAAGKKKRTIMVCNDLCASAALWVGSAAREVVITQSGDMGSIGIYRMRFDWTEMLQKDGVRVDVIRAGAQKAWGSPYLKTTEEELKVAQADVDNAYDQFINAVARNRKVDADFVRSEWADARIFTGQQAVDVGLADRVASFDQVLAELVGRDVFLGDDGNVESIRDPGQPTARKWSGRIRRG